MALSRMPKGNTIPVDPDVKIPAAVRAAAAAADARQREAHPEQQPPADPNAPPLQQLPSDEQIKLAEPPPAQRLPSVVTTIEAAPAPQTHVQQPTPVPAPADNDDSWKAKYEAQLGRVRHLTTQNKELGDRIGVLETMMETRAPASAAPAPVEKLITSQEEEDFGPEMVDVMRRAAREATTPLLNEIASLKNQLGSTTATITRNSRQEMLASLNSSLPEWKQVNVAPEFHAWLALPDPFSGATRKGLLQAAYDKNETSRVLAFFRSFISELAATTPVEDQQTQVVTETPSRPTLKDLAAPGRARTAARQELPAEKPIIRTSDINALYKAKREGKYDGREAEFLGYERELELAQREGRIVRDT